ALPHARELNHFLAEQPFEDDAPRRTEFFDELGRSIARLHATGVNHPDLYSIHIHVARRASRWQVWFLDFQRSTWRREIRLEMRVRDLAALAATLPERLADKHDRAALWDGYLAESKVGVRMSQLAAAIDRRSQRLLTRRKFWEIRESDTQGHQSAPNVELEGPTTLWIDAAYSQRLERAGLTTFSAMMSTRDGLLLRALKDRENWRLRLDSVEPCGAYLKKHHQRSLATWLRAKAGWGLGETPGRTEARNVASLARGGIAAMRLIAFGEKLHEDGLLESFVLTEELVGFTQLDHFLRQRFSPRHATRVVRRDPELEELIRCVASVASRFHRLGYNHRDLYCCHFFIREPSCGEFHVNLIDLQRVEHRRRFRRRWLVKDLAQLAYSVPCDRITCTQKLAFMKHYLGVRKLDARHKRFIRRVLAKQQAMERNLGAHP
ncbi:MAG: hypothetical protein HY000_02680, partial [Planctomycetes bacterium]|nr:hypothetical protein [Planctomycetota bacterium]